MVGKTWVNVTAGLLAKQADLPQSEHGDTVVMIWELSVKNLIGATRNDRRAVRAARAVRSLEYCFPFCKTATRNYH
mgnify:CR=1 FL=1